ncbi:Zinc finger, SWIM-type [Cordyceps fumosorosea ARSEF 2679]|uniref:Zinc finger, SWIM-type n=1 Tax=Cordyceps fumosorosea (strain ARSEF 2679) TaxID=1081104 RepID=A0A168E0Z1_CORFA|nr:Zinc finger, SWIM-type [Cordyceps fumosorosea ARSEF 2679]OAA73247.1 Zinc finger, SWIM-type [Cordyceps fumosorosea ARSEF 2679]
MPPTLRLSVPVTHQHHSAVLGRDDYETPSSTASDSDDSCSSGSEDEQPNQVYSPTRLVYNLDALPEKTKSTVRDAFNEPPAMVVQHCRQVEEDTFAFQMSEVVTRSIRIRAPSSGRARLTCSCRQGATATVRDSSKDKEQQQQPCHHVLWLLDQLAKQTLYETDHEKPLTMTSAGYPEEMGDPFSAIADHHLNIVADGLHCRHVDRDCYDPRRADEKRMRESRELLSSVYKRAADVSDESPAVQPARDPRCLDHTVFKMLVDDDLFFHYFLSEATAARGGSDAMQQFRLLTHRINVVLQDFDQHNYHRSDTPSSSTTTPSTHTVAWAARHIRGVISLVRYAIWSGKRPLNAAERAAAAKTLLHVLDGVVGRGGDLLRHFLGDDGFVLDELETIPEGAALHAHALERLAERMARCGASSSYAIRFRKFITQIKAREEVPSASLKRSCSEDSEAAVYKRRR